MPSRRERWAIALAVSALPVFIAAACSNDDGAEPSTRDAAVAAASCDAASVNTYATFAGPFFLNWCTGCHSSALPEGERQDAPLGVDFDSLEGIRAHQEQIRLRVHVQETMPPAGGPTEEERAALAEWLACSLPLEDAGFDPPDPPDAAPGDDGSAPGDCGQLLRMPAELPTPRCAPSTLDCFEECALTAAEEDADDCRDACVDLDPTPAHTAGVLPVDCGLCRFLSLLDCADRNGCGEAADSVRCCLEGCFGSADPGCFETRCTAQIQTFGLCVYYTAEACLAPDVPGEGCF